MPVLDCTPVPEDDCFTADIERLDDPDPEFPLKLEDLELLELELDSLVLVLFIVIFIPSELGLIMYSCGLLLSLSLELPLLLVFFESGSLLEPELVRSLLPLVDDDDLARVISISGPQC